MTKRAILIGTAVTAVFLAGCGSNTAGTATTAATTSAASSTSSSAGTSSSATSTTSTTSKTSTTSTSSSSGTGTSASKSGSVVPAELDDTSKAWFANFCTAIVGLEGTVTATPTLDKSSAQAYQAALVAQYTGVATAMTAVSAAIGSVPAPTIDGGQALNDGVVTAFDTIGGTVLAAAQQFAAAPVTDVASVDAANASLAATLAGSLKEVGTTVTGMQSTVTPEIDAAVSKLPECAPLGGG